MNHILSKIFDNISYSYLNWCAVCLVGFLTISNANAMPVHGHSDIEFEFVGGGIEIEFAQPSFFIFEGDFNGGLIPGLTDDPGFNNDEFVGTGNTPLPGSFLGFNVLGPLSFWNGTEFASAGSASIDINDVAGHTSTISSSTSSDLASFSSPFENIIGVASATGEIHQHIDFVLNSGITGAYGLLLSLTTNQIGITDSQIFGIFFNNGLDQVLFEAGVDAFNASVVPVPAAVWLFASALVALVTMRRQKAL